MSQGQVRDESVLKNLYEKTSLPKCIYCGEENAVAVLNYGEGRYCHIGIDCLKNKVFMHKWIIINDEDLSHPFVTDALKGRCSECANKNKCSFSNERTDKERWCGGFRRDYNQKV